MDIKSSAMYRANTLAKESNKGAEYSVLQATKFTAWRCFLRLTHRWRAPALSNGRSDISPLALLDESLSLVDSVPFAPHSCHPRSENAQLSEVSQHIIRDKKSAF
jgi:hypothetical protein